MVPAEVQEAKAVAKRPYAKLSLAVAGYSICSSLMLVINKLAITFVPAPSFVLFIQLLFAAVTIRGMSLMGVIDADPLDFSKGKPFILVSMAFLGALYTNVKTLQYANVETFVVFRSSTPCLIAILDFVFLGRQLPNARSCASLGAIICGAVAYIWCDSNFEVRAYGWVVAWYVIFAFDQIYIKYVVDQSSLNAWGQTYYTNTLAVPLVLVVALLTREDVEMYDLRLDWISTSALIGSCVAGVLMSYSAFLLRGLVSATTFTVVGTMCKIATVVINCLIWDKHASLRGLAALFVCLFAGVWYQQAPLRAASERSLKICSSSR